MSLLSIFGAKKKSRSSTSSSKRSKSRSSKQDTPHATEFSQSVLKFPDESKAMTEGDNSIFTAIVASELPADADKSEASPLQDVSARSRLPLIGKLPTPTQQGILWTLLALGGIGLLLSTFLALKAGKDNAGQVGAAGQALTQSQRLAKSAAQALLGSSQAFKEVNDSSAILLDSLKGLNDGGGTLGIKPIETPQIRAPFDVAYAEVPEIERSTETLKEQGQVLSEVGQAIRSVNRRSNDMLDAAETVSSLKLQRGASPAELGAAGQLVMLTQRIGKSANEFLTVEGVSPEAVFLMGKDLNTFGDIVKGMLEGSADLGLPKTTDPEIVEQLTALQKVYEAARVDSNTILKNLQGMISAREAQDSITKTSSILLANMDTVQKSLSQGSGLSKLSTFLIGLSVALLAIAVWGLVEVSFADQRQRAAVAESQRALAENQEREAKRVNDANQAAILRLMNELQTVAEGDLTQQATVTEDITGAIADSVNYTVEELRTLVSQVQGTVERVTQTTQLVESTSTELLATSDEQLREIRETGESVLQMANRINHVSSQAQQSAEVARQSLQAAESGLSAVQNAIGGMNAIRDQIQDTSKRIKRLGESSQEIGEITELISDITEQTNVLALNAAIQAASAGEAGRGFSVVAEEVQRLAERSADATRQIAALVKTIQTDTADAVAAMERSTQGVVEGAKLSDNAGTALTEIDAVSRRLAELIEQISEQSLREAASANVVADNIQHIFAVTEQTGEGTRSTAQLVRELSRSAEELKQSVSRFKIS